VEGGGGILEVDGWFSFSHCEGYYTWHWRSKGINMGVFGRFKYALFYVTELHNAGFHEFRGTLYEICRNIIHEIRENRH
jgi:hypothetical protein